MGWFSFRNKYAKSFEQTEAENKQRLNRKYNQGIREHIEYILEEEKKWENAMEHSFVRGRIGSIEKLLKLAESDAKIYGMQFVFEEELKTEYLRLKRQCDEYYEMKQRQDEECRRKSECEHEERLLKKQVLEEELRGRTQSQLKMLMDAKQKRENERLEKKEQEENLVNEQQLVEKICCEILKNQDFCDVKLKFGKERDCIEGEIKYVGYAYGVLNAKKNGNQYVARFDAKPSSAVEYEKGHSIIKSLAVILAEVDFTDMEAREFFLKKSLIGQKLIQLDSIVRFEIRDGYLVVVIDEEEILFKFYTSKNQIIRKNFDLMEGHEFEFFCAEVLKGNGFEKINVTQGSGDQGIDIIAIKDGIKYGIQCKCYSSEIGNRAVQEALGGKTFYQCHIGVVLTNNYFTKSAVELAQRSGIVLWDRTKLLQLIESQK